MATLNILYPTLLDMAKQPGVSDGPIIELLAQSNPILEDALALPCNDGLSHQTTVRTGLPEVTWGKLYKGVAATKGTKQIVKDTTGFVESASIVDVRLVDIVEKAEEKASIRMDEASGHLEAMAQEAAQAIFYADSSIEPEKPMGFAPRFNDLSAENASQVIDGGGTGSDNTSIWLITFDKQACHLLYPKNASMGLKRHDHKGDYMATDGDGNEYRAYREDFSWHFGLTVRNWQYVSRVCNIDVSDLVVDAATGANITNLMTEMYYAHKGRRQSQGRSYIYATTTIVKFLDYQSRLETGINLFLTFAQTGVNAKEVLHFRGIPIRETDAILETEARVV